MEPTTGPNSSLVLFNPAARDIQKWEYVPLGPFGAKNFCTTISPWIVTLEALEPFRCPTSAGTQTDPEPLPYLRDPAYGSYDIKLEVAIKNPSFGEKEAIISKGNFSCLYWNIKQQLTHHTVTGCNMRPGDLLGSGTISGSTPDSYGSLLELAWKGTKPLEMPDGTKRVFLQDGDSVIMRGWCQGEDGLRVGFGSCAGKVLPAQPYVAPSSGAGSS
jgi:fumarylacetoacetase